jgi:glycosyltransferase involved in cell wall biosynthesis
MKKISLLIILPSLAGGGAEKVTISFIENLNPNFFDYKLIVINGIGPLKININKQQIINLNGNRFRNSFIEIIKKIKSLKPDIILSTFPHITLPLLLAKNIFFPKVLIIAREPNMVSPSLSNSSLSIILKSFYKVLMPSANRVIVNSKAMYDDLSHRKINTNKLTLLHNPVDHINIRKVNNFSRYPGKGLRLVAMGRLVYQKGFDRIIPILKEVNNAHLTILGEGPDYSKLLKMTHNHFVKNKINFQGYVDDANAYIAAADYFILPSRWEGLPNAALESLALGTPVISFEEVVGLLDIINNSKPNSIYLCKNIDEMKKILKELPVRKDLNNISLRNNLLKNFNTPLEYCEKLSGIMKETFNEREH